MIWEYKIQKIVDGNKDESFHILASRTSEHRWWKRKDWRELDRYGSDSDTDTLKEAQAIVKKEMGYDAKAEYRDNKNRRTVLKEYTFTNIPDYIPEDQEEKFCDLKGVKT